MVFGFNILLSLTLHAVMGCPQEPLTRPPSSLSLQRRALTSLLSRVRKKSTPTTPRRVPELEVGDQVEVVCFSKVRANTNQLYQWGLVSPFA